MAHLAELQEPAALGRVRGHHVLHGLAPLLVRRPHPRPRDAARPRHDADPPDRLRHRSPSAGAARTATGSNYERAYLILAGALDAARALACTRSCPSTSPSSSSPAGTRRSSRRTSSPAPSSPASRWCMTLMIIARKVVRPRGPRSRIRHLENMNKIILATGTHRWLRVRDGVLHRLVLRQSRTSGSPSSTAPSARTPGRTGRWSAATCISPQLFWFKKIRTSIPVMFVISHLRQHRHVVRALRHHRDVAAPRLPAVELGLLHARRWSTSPRSSARFGLFFTLFLLFVRFLPMIAIAEVKGVLPEADPHHGHDDHAPKPNPEPSKPSDPSGEAGDCPCLSPFSLRPPGHPTRRTLRGRVRPCNRGKVAAVVGWFETPAELYHACEALRDAGYQPSTRTRRSRCTAWSARWASSPRACLGLCSSAARSACSALSLMQWYTQAVDYPLNISGKPSSRIRPMFPSSSS